VANFMVACLMVSQLSAENPKSHWHGTHYKNALIIGPVCFQNVRSNGSVVHNNKLT
jgi:hypothetical protein